MIRSPLALGFTGLALTSICYGTLWPVTRFAVQIMSPLWYGAIRLGSAALLIAFVLALLGRFRLPPRRDMPIVLSIGFLTLGGYSVLMNLALQSVAAGRGAIIGYATVIFVAPAAAILFGETLRRARLAGVLIALGGLVVLFNPLGLDWGDRGVLIGNAQLVLGAILWSVVILHLRTHPPVSATIDLLPWQLAIGASCLALTAYASGHGFAWQWSGEYLFAFGYGILIGSAGAAWTMNLAMRHLLAVVSATGVLAAPMISLIISVGFMGEALSLTLVAGVLLIIGGIALVTLNPSRTRIVGG